MIRRRTRPLLVAATLTLMVSAETAHFSPSVAASAATRNPYTQPFASTSIWNQPIGSGAVYVPAQIAPPTARAITADETVVLMDPSAPMTTIAANGGPHSDRCVANAPITSAPIPPSLVVPSATGNFGYAVVEGDGSSLVEGGSFARCTSDAAATAASAKSYGSIYGDGITGGAGGSGLSTLGGVVRLNELVPGGQINHALRVNVDGSADLYPGPGGFRWPATREDSYGPTGYGGHNPAMKMGALLALPPSLNLGSLGLASGPGMILARALQNYGAYISNDTGTSVFSVDTAAGDASMVNQFQSAWGFPFQAAGTSGSPWADDVMRILQNLAVVDNNGPTSIGGGGTPLVPLAPSLGAVAPGSGFTPPPPSSPPLGRSAVMGGDGGMWALMSDGSFANYGGRLTAAPAVAVVPSTAPGTPDVTYDFVTGADHRLWYRTDQASWMLFSRVSFCLDNPAAVWDAARSRLTVACTGGDHGLWVTQVAAVAGAAVYSDAFTSLGGYLSFGPAVALVGGQVDFIVTGRDPQVWERSLSQGFHPMPWQCIGHPAAGSSGTLAYFGCHGTDGALWVARNQGSGWNGARSAGGRLIDGPGVAVLASGVQFSVEGVDRALWQTGIDANGYPTGFSGRGGVVVGGVGAGGL